MLCVKSMSLYCGLACVFLLSKTNLNYFGKFRGNKSGSKGSFKRLFRQSSGIEIDVDGFVARNFFGVDS